MNKVGKFLKNPFVLFNYLGSNGVLNWMPDDRYLMIAYWCKMHKKLNLTNPQTFNEKLQWLKLYDRKPQYSLMVDKYEVKNYVANIIGKEFIIPTYGVWEHFDEIDFDILPERFVLKCTHDSGGLVIVHDKKTMDKKAIEDKLEKCLKKNFYWGGREWPYKNVKPRIIAEKYMEDAKTKELRDYKFFSFRGKTKLMFIASDRQKPGASVKFDFYDMGFNHLNLKHGHENAVNHLERPKSFDLMNQMACRLSNGIPFLRVDFYEVDGKPYFGELTFSHHCGMEPFQPEEWDRILGEWIEL